MVNGFWWFLIFDVDSRRFGALGFLPIFGVLASRGPQARLVEKEQPNKDKILDQDFVELRRINIYPRSTMPDGIYTVSLPYAVIARVREHSLLRHMKQKTIVEQALRMWFARQEEQQAKEWMDGPAFGSPHQPEAGKPIKKRSMGRSAKWKKRLILEGLI